jgi:hypothetical protein
MMGRVALVIPLAALIVACGRDNVAPTDNRLTPVAPSAAITTTNGVSAVGARVTPGRIDVLVNMQDAYTFNEALQTPKPVCALAVSSSTHSSPI